MLLTRVVSLPIADPNLGGDVFVESVVTGSAGHSVDTGSRVQSPERRKAGGAGGQLPAQELGPGHGSSGARCGGRSAACSPQAVTSSPPEPLDVSLHKAEGTRV